ncbi:CLUMA_CG017770, isoform A [Clunio marinus]|uniref:CLUMA_CG017770, isoform A n=1 Tax=Clunio marinus TaxID=568069 RepID=A0A1J1IZW0_9DIPT|nr:CLUMA_CG017770, isoform A [Clunio marinus]
MSCVVKPLRRFLFVAFVSIKKSQVRFCLHNQKRGIFVSNNGLENTFRKRENNKLNNGNGLMKVATTKW